MATKIALIGEGSSVTICSRARAIRILQGKDNGNCASYSGWDAVDRSEEEIKEKIAELRKSPKKLAEEHTEAMRRMEQG